MTCAKTAHLFVAISLLMTSLGLANTVHVSPNGNDSGAGTLDAPLATLHGARDYLRAKRKDGGLNEGPVHITLHGGTYAITETITLAAEDSGTVGSPVIWQAAPGEEVRLVGGVPVTGWKPVSDESILKRLPAQARGNVYRADLRACGATDLGSVKPGITRAELFFGNRYMRLARYPDEGFVRIADVPEDAKQKRPVSISNRPDLDRHEGPFLYDGDRPTGWQSAKDVWMHGYWFHDWSDEYHPVDRFDLEKKEVWPRPPYHRYGYKKDQRYYFLNLLEELDQPGEWYLDRTSGVIYFRPPASIDTREAMFPCLQQPMLVLAGVRHVAVRGITFECSRAGAVEVKGGEHVELAGCTIRNVGGTAINITGGKNHVVRSCDIHDVAATGIRLKGGNRQTLERADHRAENCHIYRFAQVIRTYAPAIRLDGVGNRVSHCFVHDCPHVGIAFEGNEHVSEFTRIAEETGDVGCINTAFDWTYAGHVVRHNYFHHIHAPGKLGCFVIYPDLPCGNIHLYGNVFHEVDQVFHTNSGRGMLIENNMFIKCRRGLQFRVWSDMKKFLPGGNWQMVERLAKVNYDQPPYSTRYPVLARLAEDFAKGDEHVMERALPKDNVIRRNISWGDSFFLCLWPQAERDLILIEQNVIANPVVFRGSKTGNAKMVNYWNGDETIARELAVRGNIIVKDNPGIADPESEDFSIKPGSPASSIKFEPIPLDQIGLQIDQYRKSLPTRSRKAEKEASGI